MLFSSFEFLFRFLPVFLVIYYLTPKKFRNVTLLGGSIVFYTIGEAGYITILLACVLVNYTLTRLMYRKNTDGRGIRQKRLLLLALGYDLGVLFFFKYSGLASGLPLGISFYTFQIMAYVIDVYRGRIPAEQSLLRLGTYLTMFPQLISGPITNYADVRVALGRERKIKARQLEEGMKLLIIGLAAKVVIADRIGTLWNSIRMIGFDSISTKLAWMGAFAYSLQLYFDFAGYSMMARGIGKMLGFELPVNFRYPYISKSVTEFWRRWHITLGRWFREYVYIPLGGNRKGLPRQILNILIVWTLTGIWHGAGWNFLFWGLWFALFLILEKLFLGELLKNAPVVFGRVYTLAVVLISWVFFALEKPGEILAYLQAMFGLNGVGLVNSKALFLGNEYLVLLVIALIACLPLGNHLVHALRSSKTGPAMALYRLGEKVIPAALLILSIAYIVDASYNPFLYFRF